MARTISSFIWREQFPALSGENNLNWMRRWWWWWWPLYTRSTRIVDLF
jgi:hypothetical protein